MPDIKDLLQVYSHLQRDLESVKQRQCGDNGGRTHWFAGAITRGPIDRISSDCAIGQEHRQALIFQIPLRNEMVPDTLPLSNGVI
jgi:hypothetical protein